MEPAALAAPLVIASSNGRRELVPTPNVMAPLPSDASPARPEPGNKFETSPERARPRSSGAPSPERRDTLALAADGASTTRPELGLERSERAPRCAPTSSDAGESAGTVAALSGIRAPSAAGVALPFVTIGEAPQ